MSLIPAQNNFLFLRLFATIAITYLHSFNLLGKDNKEFLYYFSEQKIDFGFVGLAIFFSISGYLIAKSATHSTSLKNFIWKRFLRIQPLLIIVVLFSIFIVGVIFTNLNMSSYFMNIQTWTYLRNIFPVFGIQFQLPSVFTQNVIDDGVNGSMWTLVIEERLYVLMALLLILPKHKILIFKVAILCLNIAYSLNLFLFDGKLIPDLDTPNLFYALIFLNAAFLYLHNFNFSKKPSVLLLLSFLGIIVSISYTPLFCTKVIFTPLFVLCLTHLKAKTNNLRIGDLSYGIYLFSFPVQQILITNNLVYNNPWCLFVITMLIVTPTAFLSWHFFEKRILAYKNFVS